MKRLLLLLAPTATILMLGIGTLATVSARVQSQAPVTIQISDTGFVPSRINSVVNQDINLKVVNVGSKVHEFAIPYYYIYSENLQPGGVTTIRFTPSTSGIFDIMSDPSGTNQPEFLGKLVVTDHK